MPPKSRSPEAEEPQYLFVNQDAHTLLRNTKDTELDRTKQRHVQKQGVAKRRRLRQRALSFQSLPAPPEPPTSHPSTARSRSEGTLFTLTENLGFSPFLISESALDSVPAIELRDGGIVNLIQTPLSARSFRQPAGQPVTPVSDSALPSPIQYRNIPRSVSGDVVDPFASTQVALEQWAPPLIQYYTMIIMPQMFNIEARTFSLPEMRHAAAVHADMQACMSDPAHMYALLAASSARMLRYEGALLLPNVEEHSFQRVPIFFKTKAIESLRHRLSRGHLDKSVVVDIHRLMATAVYLEDTEVADAHFQALAQMIRDLGGFETLDDYTKERIISLNLNRALLDLKAPSLSLTWDPGRIPDHLKARISRRSRSHNQLLGSRFVASSSNAVSDEIKEISLDLIDVVQVYIDATRPTDLSHNDFKWIAQRQAAIEHRLLSLVPAHESDAKSSCQECVRLALIFWMSMTLADPIQAKTVRRLSHRFVAQVQPLDWDLWRPDLDLLLWVVITGALAVGGIGGDGDNDERWLTRLLGTTARLVMEQLNMEISDVTRLEEVLCGFFYIAEQQPQPHQQQRRQRDRLVELLASSPPPLCSKLDLDLDLDLDLELSSEPSTELDTEIPDFDALDIEPWSGGPADCYPEL